MQKLVGKSSWWQNCSNLVFLVTASKSFVHAISEAESKNGGKWVCGIFFFVLKSRCNLFRLLDTYFEFLVQIRSIYESSNI